MCVELVFVNVVLICSCVVMMLGWWLSRLVGSCVGIVLFVNVLMCGCCSVSLCFGLWLDSMLSCNCVSLICLLFSVICLSRWLCLIDVLFVLYVLLRLCVVCLCSMVVMCWLIFSFCCNRLCIVYVWLSW